MLLSDRLAPLSNPTSLRTKLEQDDDDDGVGNVFSAGAGARANATVGQLLNHHTEMGGQLRSVHKKMSSIVEQLKKDKEAVCCTTKRLEPCCINTPLLPACR